MTIKRVRLNEKVHQKLIYLKEQTHARSLNDVIESLITINEEYYLNNGTLNVRDKKVLLKYDDGKIVEIQIQSKK